MQKRPVPVQVQVFSNKQPPKKGQNPDVPTYYKLLGIRSLFLLRPFFARKVPGPPGAPAPPAHAGLDSTEMLKQLQSLIKEARALTDSLLNLAGKSLVNSGSYMIPSLLRALGCQLFLSC